MPTKKTHNARSSADLKALLILGLLTLSPLTIAEEYTDELSECLLGATSEEDKLSLVKWMFTAIALLPAVEEIPEVSLSAREQANREMAASHCRRALPFLGRLLLRICSQTKV